MGGQLALPPSSGMAGGFSVPVPEQRTDVHVHVHGLDKLQELASRGGGGGGGDADQREVDELRKLVKDLMKKNQDLQSGQASQSDTPASNQVSGELADAIKMLRHRMSCMDKKLDDGGGGGRGRKSTFMRRASSAESLFAGFGGGGDANPRVMLDLTAHGGGDGSDPMSTNNDSRQTRRSTCMSMIDLSDCRATIKPP
jgi:hypothetical protein